jgi:hypothetical protein
MIDAVIFGKPVCTVELPGLARGQRGYAHFEYLMTVGGGFVRTTRDLDEHLAMLGELLRCNPYERDERSDRLVQAFVRPHGQDVTPATVFSTEMLELLASPSDLRRPSRLGQAVGGLTRWAAPVIGAPLTNKVVPPSEATQLAQIRVRTSAAFYLAVTRGGGRGSAWRSAGGAGALPSRDGSGKLVSQPRCGSVSCRRPRSPEMSGAPGARTP